MTSKERLLKCIAHEPVDHVPISTHELNGWNPYSWENQQPSYQRLMDTVREYTDCMYLLDPAPLAPAISGRYTETQRWTQGNKHFTRQIVTTANKQLQARFQSEEGINTQWTLEHLLKDLQDIDEYLNLPYETPQPDMPNYLKTKDELGDRGVMLLSISDPIAEAASLFGMAEFLVYAMTDTEKIKYFLDALHERQLDYLKKILAYDVKDIIIRVYGPEYATPPYLPTKYFHSFVTCYLKELCTLIKDAGAIPRIHCHGKIAHVIDEFAETDAVAIDPLEPPPDGDMELADIKRKYGRKFCLMGNIEIKELEMSSLDRIDSLVKVAMDSAKDGSGFILMPTACPLNAELSPKTENNYLKMIESALKHGIY